MKCRIGSGFREGYIARMVDDYGNHEPGIFHWAISDE
jgi:hypothetical protein